MKTFPDRLTFPACKKLVCLLRGVRAGAEAERSFTGLKNGILTYKNCFVFSTQMLRARNFVSSFSQPHPNGFAHVLYTTYKGRRRQRVV